MESDSDYDARAEFHEVFMPAPWAGLRTVMAETFGGVGPDGVIVDVGAGSGVGSAIVADVTGAEIIVLEPNTTMRAMLIARLDNAGVLERVTVLAGSVPEGLHDLPERVDGVIAAHMLGHLSDSERTDLLGWIATSLVPGRSAVLTVTPDVTADDGQPAVEERAVGRHLYRVTHRPAAPGRYEGVFEVIDRERRVVRSLHDSTTWETVTAGDVRAVLAGHPVVVDEPQPGVVLVTARL